MSIVLVVAAPLLTGGGTEHVLSKHVLRQKTHVTVMREIKARIRHASYLEGLGA